MTAVFLHCPPCNEFICGKRESHSFRTLLALHEQNHMEAWLGRREGCSHPSLFDSLSLV